MKEKIKKLISKSKLEQALEAADEYFEKNGDKRIEVVRKMKIEYNLYNKKYIEEGAEQTKKVIKLSNRLLKLIQGDEISHFVKEKNYLKKARFKMILLGIIILLGLIGYFSIYKPSYQTNGTNSPIIDGDEATINYNN